MSTHLKVVTLQESNFRDPVATLRLIADDMESGQYGEIGCVAVVILGHKLSVIGLGPDAEAPSVALLLQAGIQKLAEPILRTGETR